MMKKLFTLILLISILNSLQVSADYAVVNGIPNENKVLEIVLINNKPKSAEVTVTSSSFIKVAESEIHLNPYEAKVISLEITIPLLPQTGEVTFTEKIGNFEMKLTKHIKVQHNPLLYIMFILFGAALFAGSNMIRLILLLVLLPGLHAQSIVNETVDVLNIPPITYNVTILPSEVYDNDTLTCFAIYDDANYDSGQLEFTWFVNGIQIASNIEGANPQDYIQNGQTLSGVFEEGDIVNCTVLPYDFQDYGIRNSTEAIVLARPEIPSDKDKLHMVLKGHCVDTEFSIYIYSNGEPIVDAHITLEKESGDIIITGRTDENGYFYFTPTEVMKIKVKAQKSGYTNAYGIINVYNDSTCYTKPKENQSKNETELKAGGYEISIFDKIPPLILEHVDGIYEEDIVVLRVTTPRKIGDLLILDEPIPVEGANVIVYWIGNETNISDTKNPLFIFEGISDANGEVRFLGRYAYNYYSEAKKVGYTDDEEYFDLLPREKVYGSEVPSPAPQQVNPDCFYILASMSLSFLGLGYLRFAKKEIIELKS